jgi:hypothetical protein
MMYSSATQDNPSAKIVDAERSTNAKGVWNRLF